MLELQAIYVGASRMSVRQRKQQLTTKWTSVTLRDTSTQHTKGTNMCAVICVAYTTHLKQSYTMINYVNNRRTTDIGEWLRKTKGLASSSCLSGDTGVGWLSSSTMSCRGVCSLRMRCAAKAGNVSSRSARRECNSVKSMYWNIIHKHWISGVYARGSKTLHRG